MGALAAGIVIGYASPATYQLRDHVYELNTTYELNLQSYPHEASNLTENEGRFGQNYFNYNLSHSFHNSSSFITGSENLVEVGNPPLKLNPDELSWFSASLNIGALLGSLLASPMLNLMGRKGAMISATIPNLLGWLLLGKNFPIQVMPYKQMINIMLSF